MTSRGQPPELDILKNIKALATIMKKVGVTGISPKGGCLNSIFKINLVRCFS
jgi:hypothetical protein